MCLQNIHWINFTSVGLEWIETNSNIFLKLFQQIPSKCLVQNMKYIYEVYRNEVFPMVHTFIIYNLILCNFIISFSAMTELSITQWDCNINFCSLCPGIKIHISKCQNIKNVFSDKSRTIKLHIFWINVKLLQPFH